MEFQVSKAAIMQGINLVKGAVAGKTTNPILKTIYMSAKSDGWVLLRATNLVMDISAEIKATVTEPGEVCISDLVTDLLPTFEEGTYKDGLLTNPIKFVFNDKGLSVTQGKRRHRPAYVPVTDFPKQLVVEGYNQLTNEQRANLIESFQRLQVSVGVTEDRRILQGFHINPHTKHMVTGDGTRVSYRGNFDIPGNIANPPAKLIMGVLSNLVSLSPKDILEIKTSGLVAFKAQQIANDEVFLKFEILINGLDGDYPARPVELIDEAIARDPHLTIRADKPTLIKILEICNVYSQRAFNEGKSQHVTLMANEQGIVFSMHVPDLIEMEEPLDCKYDGDDFTYLFHPGMALEALRIIKSDVVELVYAEPLKPFLIFEIVKVKTEDGEKETRSDFVYLQGAMKDKKNEQTQAG